MKKIFWAFLLVGLLATVTMGAPTGIAKDVYIDLATRTGEHLDAYPIWFGTNYDTFAGAEMPETNGYKVKSKDQITFYFENEKVIGFAIEEELKHARIFDERYRAMGWKVAECSEGTVYCYQGSVKRKNKWTDDITTWHQDESRFYGIKGFASRWGVTEK